MLKPILTCSVLFCLIAPFAQLLGQTQPAVSPSVPAASPIPPYSSAAAAAAAPLPDPQTPEEFFARARQLGDLEASGIPFHLKATYVASGDTEFTGNGTYEEWWQSKDLWRKEATLGDYRYVANQTDGKNTVYGSSDYVPLRLRQMLDAVLIRIAPDAGMAHAWSLKRKKLRGVKFAILSSEYQCGDLGMNVGCLTEDDLTPEGVLRIRAGEGAEDVYNNFHAFRGLAVPADIAVSRDARVILRISIQSLELLKPGETESLKNASPPTDLQSVPAGIDMTREPKTKMPKLIHSILPMVPVDADYSSGSTTVIDMTIDTTGKVREPFVIQSAGRLLDDSKLDAVREWRFSPTTIDGVLVCVHARIAIIHKIHYWRQ